MEKTLEKYLTDDLNQLPIALGGVIVMYLLIMLFTRIFGLKSFAKMTGFDFVNTIAIGNIMAMSISTSNPTLLTGIVLIGLLYLVNHLISVARFKNKKIRTTIDNQPLLLMKDGSVIDENIKASKMTLDEIRGKLREANVIRMSEVKAMILETTGDVSVLHGSEDHDVDAFLLENVRMRTNT